MNARDYAKLCTVTQFTEWVAEPVDEFGDIIDPRYVSSRAEAEAEVAGLFAEFPASEKAF